MQENRRRHSAGAVRSKPKGGCLAALWNQVVRTLERSGRSWLLEVEIDADDDLRFDRLAAKCSGTITPLADGG